MQKSMKYFISSVTQNCVKLTALLQARDFSSYH